MFKANAQIFVLAIHLDLPVRHLGKLSQSLMAIMGKNSQDKA